MWHNRHLYGVLLLGFLLGVVSCTGCAMGKQATERNTTIFGPDMRHTNMNRLYNFTRYFLGFPAIGR